MHMNIEIAGISPNTMIRYARSLKITDSEAHSSYATTPIASVSSSSTRGKRKESKSFGFLGPGTT
jgi:hypothetical protein